MNKKECIKRLCQLVSNVGEDVYKNKYPHDCFCGKQSNHDPIINDDIIEFIERAVYLQISAYICKNYIPDNDD
jgi:hypothetical protein